MTARRSLGLICLLLGTAFAAPAYAADDYSDAPASYGVATHTIVAGTQLGATITSETSAVQDADNASDDGALIPPLDAGATSYVLHAADFAVTGTTGNLYVWIDFNGNGTFETTEFASTTVNANVVASDLTFSGFGTVTASGSTYARVRFTSSVLTSANATGAAANGEVEDYVVGVAVPQTFPADPNLATCPMDSSSTFPTTTVISWPHSAPNYFAPNIIAPAEIASAANAVAGSGILYTNSNQTGRLVGADHSGYLAAYQAGDYAQYSFTTSSSLSAGRFIRQLRYGVTIPASTPNLPYKVSVLFSTDPSFTNATLIVDSHTAVAQASPTYLTTFIPIIKPVYIAPSTTYYMRVIFHDVTSSTADVHWDDFATLFSNCRDYGDAPASYGTPPHAVMNGGTTLHLGASVESEGAAWTSTGADGDNTNGINDEDGVSAFLTLKGGSSATYTLPAANITALGTGTLYAWVDFNNNGTFDSNEFATTTVTANALAGDLTFSGFGAVAASGTTYARLRLTTDTLTSANATLAANNGEVEDYALTITPDIAPVITSNGGGATAVLSVAENQTAATTVIATDVDADTLTYSISGGVDAALFSIDPSTGVLTFNAAPDFESPTDADANNTYIVQVTVSDGRGGTAVQDLTITVTDVVESNVPAIGGSGTCTATGGTDVIFLLDNSGSVLAGEYTDYASTVVSIGNTLLTANPSTRIAVAHYAGPVAGGSVSLADFGQYLSLERDFSTAALSSPVRQFPNIYNYGEDNLAGAVNQLSYALDGNAITTSSFILSPLKELSRDLTRPLQIVIFTDAYRDGSVAGSAMIDGVGYGYEPNDGSNFTIYNLLKAQGVKFSVAALTLPNGITADERDGAAAAIASVGGSWSGIIESNPMDPEGSQTSPRRYETSSTFLLSAAQITNFVTPIANICPTAAPNTAPVISSDGSGATAALSVAENQTAVTTVTATDADPADTLTYSISGGADATLFSIDPSTGVLTFIAAPDFESPTDADSNNTYIVQVTVDDGNGGTDVQDITVTVTDVVETTNPAFPNGAGLANSVCSVQTATSTSTDAGIYWSHNASGGTSLAAQIARTDLIAIAGDESSTGLASQVQSGTTQVNMTTVPTQYDPNYYIQYTFTTANLAGKVAELTGLSLSVYNKGDVADTFATGAYHFAIQVDDDPAFGSPTTLISDVSLNNGDTSTATVAATPVDLGQGIQTQLRFDANGTTVPLVSNTAYTIRVFVYGASAAGSTGSQAYPTIVLWDDIMFKLVSCGYDRGDAPAVYGDPTHKILGTIKMGSGDPDPELAALSSMNADGDDTDATDDENGVTLPLLTQGNTAVVPVVVSGAGYLQAWIDWNGNNAWDASEQIATDLQDGGANDTNPTAGAISFNVAVPSDAVLTQTYARFRWSSVAGLDSTAAAIDGEVEDYAVLINAAPTITSDSGGATAALSVAENQTAVTTVTATDANPTDTLTYSISGGADSGLFSIDPSTGILTFTAAPDFESPTDADGNNAYEVQVSVSDGNGGTDVQDLTITVTDVAENVAPDITSDGGAATAAVSVAENQTAVTTVTATDADPTDTLTYSISGGADAALFSIDPSTGVLTFTAAPDFESPADADMNNAYLVQVTVSDGNGGTDIQDLTITVTDVNEAIKLTVMGWLQGPYDSNTSLMQDALRSRSFLPATQPYGQYPSFNYTGTETVSGARLAITGANAVVDWVLVELRDPLDPTVIITRKAALLTREGNVLEADTDSPELSFSVSAGSYYVVLRHRNHLAVMTQAPVALSVASATVVDFRVNTTLTYGTQAQIENGTQTFMWAGNSNADQNVIAYGAENDINPILGGVLMAPANTLLNSNYIVPGYFNADINLSGDVIYAGVNNDVNVLVGNVLLHPDNTTYSANFVVMGRVPVSP
ncbi:cadherin domain-containing protein [Thiofilum flexile]|uniref:cadherin domain-containing protein n=1 Tax=Thiofilum flexile TaxID=125627 RepID=UPI00037314FE|nr:cadherin domain-containing protein [Thiofilum flexile]